MVRVKKKTEVLYCQGRAPWIILGDFNVTLASSEHSRATDYHHSQNGMCDFQSFVSNCQLSYMSFVGPKYTLWNHREEDPIGKKLDRVLYNNVWSSVFPHSYAEFEANDISDQ